MLPFRYGQEPPIARALVDSDIFCISQSPYDATAPFYRVPMSGIASYISTQLGPLQFAGTWNATTNTPTLVSSVGVNGNIYLVNVAGTTDLNGHNNWQVGDWAVFDGGITQWVQVSNSVVSTVNIYNSNGTLSGLRQLDTNGFPLNFNGTGSVTIDTPDTYIGVSLDHALTVGSNTFTGVATNNAQVNKGKFNVILNDDTAVFSNSFIRFSDTLPVTLVLLQAGGTESLPTIVADGSLLGVMAFGAHDGGTFGGKPNFNTAAGILCFAGNGQAAGNTPASLYFNVSLGGVGNGTTFLAFNTGNNANTLLGQNVTSTALNTVVIGKDISSSVAEEIKIGNLLGQVNISVPTTICDSGDISFTASQFLGSPVQYLTVDSTGKIIPDGGSAGVNIYNSDGTLTGNRVVAVGAHSLQFSATIGSSMAIDVTTLNLNSPNLTIEGLSINFTAAQFVGGGNQYLGVDNSGVLFAITPPPSTNIYNTNGTLTSLRTVSLNNNSLTFSGTSGTMLVFNQDQVNLSVTAGQFNVTSSIVNFNMLAGGGTRYVTVDNLGFLSATTAPTDTNIYNTDGTLTGNRGVTLGSNILLFSGNTTGTLSNFEVTSGFINFNGVTTVISSTNLNISTPNISLVASQFVGSGTQYLTVDNTGLIVPTSSGGAVNIYNSDGTLSGNRTVTLGTDTLSFSGVGGITFGSGCTASGASSFAQGNTNSVTSLNAVIMGGLLNNNAGLESGIFVSNGSTITAGSGTIGYGGMLACYNTTMYDNLTICLGTLNGVNRGLRSSIFGGQTNKINAPNTLATSDCFIFGGDTNTVTGNVTNSTMGQSFSCVVGDNSAALTGVWMMNTTSSTAINSANHGYMVDLSGTNNTLQANYSFLINSKSCSLITNQSGVGGRYAWINANGTNSTNGAYCGVFNTELGSMNGFYSSMLSCYQSNVATGAIYSSILAGQSNSLNGAGNAILMGIGNTIGNFNFSAAIGSDITISHDNCIIINDGGFSISSGAAQTVLISGANGVSIGKGTNTPTRDVFLGKKLGVFAVSIGVDFSTDTTPAILYNVDTSAGNVISTLANPDKIGGNVFIFAKTSAANSIILSPTSGTINGSSTFSLTAIGNYIVSCDGTNWTV